MASKKSKRSTGRPKGARPASAPKGPGATSNREKRHQEKERAKEALAARQAAEKRRSLLVNTVVVGAIAVVVLGVALFIWKDANKPVVKPSAMSKDYGLLVGKADAAQKVVVYEDFLCGPCGQVESAIGGQVEAATKSGGASVEYRPIDQLGTDYSKNSAQAMWAVLDTSDAETARAFHDALFDDQPTEASEHLSESELADLAAKSGADRSKVLAALEDDTYEGLVEKATKEAQRLGSQMPDGRFTTPTILINGELQTSSSLSDVIGRVNGVLQAAAQPAAQPSGQPSVAPSGLPSVQPSVQPSAQPSM